MTEKNKNLKQLNTARYWFYPLFVALYLFPLISIFVDGFDNMGQFARRIVGLEGISSLFITILLSLLVKESKLIFGIYYIKIHHFFSIISLILISIHPIVVAINFGTSSVFIPKLDSWNNFFTEGGRVALYLIYFAVIVAILRKSIKKHWKHIHYLLYPAFFLSAIHGILKGSDLGNPLLSLLFIAMISVVIIIFFYKRYLNIIKK